MSITHGGQRARRFKWSFQQGQVVIKNEYGLTHEYSVQEITRLLTVLFEEFGHEWIPLANNVQKMHEGTEIPGLGSTIYRLRPGDTFHAQGASYLGVVLDEAGFLEWNGRARGIKWRIVSEPANTEVVRQALGKERIEPNNSVQSPPAAEGGSDQTSYTIDTHKHNFAVWAAARAVQRGFTTVKKLRETIEVSGVQYAVTQIGDPMCSLARTAHPPIDRILLRNVAKASPRLFHLAQVKWTKLSETEYFDVINDLRNVLDEGKPFWKIEKHWTVTDD